MTSRGAPMDRTDEATEPRRYFLMSVSEAQMWVNFMGRRDAERYYPGILVLVKTASDRRTGEGKR
jgi:hypothetical protein